MKRVSINRVTLVGEIKDEPNIRQAGSSEKASWTLVTTEQWDGKNFDTYTKCVAWGKMADSCRDLRAGTVVYLEGQLNNRKYEQDGETKYITEVKVRDLIDLTGTSDGRNTQSFDEAPPF